jgi:hypothetical protein
MEAGDAGCHRQHGTLLVVVRHFSADCAGVSYESENMTDRDTFAAAALTGLLADSEHYRDLDDSDHAKLAYFIADAMLRERERVTEPMPKRKRAEVSLTLTADEREAIEACVKLISRDKQHGSMRKGPFMCWRERLEALRDLLERLA